MLTVEGLARGFDAVLLAMGEIDEARTVRRWGCRWRAIGIKADPNTVPDAVAKVFAAGSAVRPQKQLVKAMAEGRAAAECVHRFLERAAGAAAGEAVLQHHGPAGSGRAEARFCAATQRGRQRVAVRPLRRA